jgi:hypothetical protein
MTNSPLFTILFPTRERADVLVHSLRTAVEQEYPNLEIIVCDNDSRDNTRTVVESFCDKRIRYVNPGKRLSMSHNWEFGLSHVKSGWVTILGDDDAILPGALKRAAEIAAVTGLKSIRSNGCTYHWPSQTHGPYGRLAINQKHGYEIRRTDMWLSKVMSGQANYAVLPMLYNGGFIHMSVIAEARSITGDFFKSMNPDVYSAIAVSNIIEEYVYCHEALAINGASHHSGGSSFFRSAETDQSVSSPSSIYFSEGNIPFHPDLPLTSERLPPVSIQALVYEAYLQAQPLTGRRVSAANPSKQSELILATAGDHRESVTAWLHDFCAYHRLPFPIRSSSHSHGVGAAARWLSQRWNSTATTVIRGSSRTPLENVYSASRAAAQVGSSSPNRMANIGRRLFDRVGIARLGN